MLRKNVVLAATGLILGMLAAVFVAGKLGMVGSRHVRRGAHATLDATAPLPPGLEKATFGSGCFWCTAAVFQELNGIHSTVAGYSGGSVKKTN